MLSVNLAHIKKLTGREEQQRIACRTSFEEDLNATKAFAAGWDTMLSHEEFLGLCTEVKVSPVDELQTCKSLRKNPTACTDTHMEHTSYGGKLAAGKNVSPYGKS